MLLVWRKPNDQIEEHKRDLGHLFYSFERLGADYNPFIAMNIPREEVHGHIIIVIISTQLININVVYILCILSSTIQKMKQLRLMGKLVNYSKKKG